MQTKASVENINKKRILIVNNNMKVGGIQKSLLNLLYEISPHYDITLYLLNNVGEYLEKVPQNVRVVGCSSLYKYFGMSQAHCFEYIFSGHAGLKAGSIFREKILRSGRAAQQDRSCFQY